MLNQRSKHQAETSVSASSKILDRGVCLLSRQHQRRREADRILPRPEHQQSAVERRRDDRVALAGRALLGLAIPTSSTPIIRPRPRTSPISGCLSASDRSPSIRYAPTAAAFATSRVFSSEIVASAAAHETGLPPNVLACAPGGHAISPARATATPSGRPEAMPLAIAITSGSTPVYSIANIFPDRPIPDCTSSTTRRMPCFLVSSRRRCEELVGGHDVTAFALDRFDDDRGDFVR